MSAKQKFSDAELLKEVAFNTQSRFVGPSVRACARNFNVAYQSMSERVHRLQKKGLLVLDIDGVRLTQEGEDYVGSVNRITNNAE
jgi:Mn-dependent DtxR family transcriptional regulator